MLKEILLLYYKLKEIKQLMIYLVSFPEIQR